MSPSINLGGGWEEGLAAIHLARHRNTKLPKRNKRSVKLYYIKTDENSFSRTYTAFVNCSFATRILKSSLVDAWSVARAGTLIYSALIMYIWKRCQVQTDAQQPCLCVCIPTMLLVLLLTSRVCTAALKFNKYFERNKTVSREQADSTWKHHTETPFYFRYSFIELLLCLLVNTNKGHVQKPPSADVNTASSEEGRLKCQQAEQYFTLSLVPLAHEALSSIPRRVREGKL